LGAYFFRPAIASSVASSRAMQAEVRREVLDRLLRGELRYIAVLA
jgi:hypothetical protein